MRSTNPKFLPSNGRQSAENQFPEKEKKLDHLGQHQP